MERKDFLKKGMAALGIAFVAPLVTACNKDEDITTSGGGDGSCTATPSETAGPFPTKSPAGLVMVLLTFALASVALGVMLGTFVKTEGQASNLSVMLGMSMALLGGCWFPIELFPPAVQTAVHVLPTTWAMQGLSDLVLRGADVVQILPETAVLTGFAILFFVVGSLRKFQP